MKIKYSYLTPEDEDCAVFNSLQAFLQNRRGKMFRQLLSKERAEATDKIVIETSYPSTITIEFIKKED